MKQPKNTSEEELLRKQAESKRVLAEAIASNEELKKLAQELLDKKAASAVTQQTTVAPVASTPPPLPPPLPKIDATPSPLPKNIEETEPSSEGKMDLRDLKKHINEIISTEKIRIEKIKKRGTDPSADERQLELLQTDPRRFFTEHKTEIEGYSKAVRESTVYSKEEEPQRAQKLDKYKKEIEILDEYISLLKEPTPPPLPEPILSTPDAKKEIKNVSIEDAEKIGWGLSTIGFKVEKAKNEFFANIFDLEKNSGASELDGFKQSVNPKGVLGRFCKELKNSFIRDAKDAEKKAKDITSKKEKHRIANVGLLAGNVLKYGRMVADVTGVSLANPLRYVMMGGMLAARGAEAGKETRLKNEKFINEQNRIGKTFAPNYELTPEEKKQQEKDVARAEEEAWKIYESARVKEEKNGENVSAEALKNAYLMEIPNDLQKRLENPNTANNFLQKTFKKQIGFSLGRLGGKIDTIEKNKKLSPADKQKAKEKLLKKWEKDLRDYDRVITQYGTVDELAMAGRYAEKTSKAIVLGMQIETALVSAEKLWGTVSNIFHHFHDAHEALSSAIPAPHDAPASIAHHDSVAGAVAHSEAAHVEPSTPATAVPAEAPLTEHTAITENIPAAKLELIAPNKIAVVHQGEGTETVFRRLIEDTKHPELAKSLGFKGDINDTEALHKFSGGEAHRLAIRFGYVDDHGQEVHITEADKIAFELKMENGHPVVIEKTIDGKILGTHNDEREYKFGKTEENPYEKEVTRMVPKSITKEVLPDEHVTSHIEPVATDEVTSEPTHFDTSPTEPVGEPVPSIASTSEHSYHEIAPKNIPTQEDSVEEATRKLKEMYPPGTFRTGATQVITGADMRTTGDDVRFTGDDVRFTGGAENETVIHNFGNHDQEFHDLSISQSKYLESDPLFAKNSFDLSGTRLLEAKYDYQDQIGALFSSDADWEEVKNEGISTILNKEHTSNNFEAYLKDLQYFSKEPIKPHWWSGESKIGEYMARALQKLATGKGVVTLEKFNSSVVDNYKPR